MTLSVTASIRDRLRNKARDEVTGFQLFLVRYAGERFLGVVDISMEQTRSAQSKVEKWGIRRCLAVRQGSSALSFLM